MRVVDDQKLPVVAVDVAVDAQQVLRLDAVAVRAGFGVDRAIELRRPCVDARDDAAALVRRVFLRVGDHLVDVALLEYEGHRRRYSPVGIMMPMALRGSSTVIIGSSSDLYDAARAAPAQAPQR